MQETISDELIGKRAYERWQQRGCPQGTAEEDWNWARAQLLREQADAEEQARFEDKCREVAKKFEAMLAAMPVAKTMPLRPAARKRATAAQRRAG